ncbi:histidine kinase PWA37_001122 [Arxiozyma heterogenica]|uniref:histidine kinase n=1 Tax=Arxiozyma heterogenica TaxID=278026 RepID=A0AAN7WEP0_9SACH|nr:hypothetical protein RI543_004647 [Kazachstania heterogenica]
MTNLRKFPPRPPYRVSLRAQLTVLVSIVAIVSLVILAITTGVYFTDNFKNLESDRLYIAAQLKSSQIDQNLNYLYYQCYYVASRDTLQTSLTNYVAGNNTEANWVDTQSILEKFLSSSDLFSVVRIYDALFNNVLNATNNGTGDLIPQSVLNKLLPLSMDNPLPSSLETTGILTDPVKNGTSYLMSMSLPIFANPSIILSDSRVYGYITIVMSANGLLSVLNDTTALAKSNVAIVSAKYTNYSMLDSYKFVFPPYGAPTSIINSTFLLVNGSFLSDALKLGKGGSLKSTFFFYHSKVAVGYSPCTSTLTNWVAVVTQVESVFLSPSTRLARIIAGTVVAIGVFVMFMTFPLAYWAVKPIVRLQKATELITEGRGLRPTTPSSMSRTSSIKQDRAFVRPLAPVTPLIDLICPSSANEHNNSNISNSNGHDVTDSSYSNNNTGEKHELDSLSSSMVLKSKPNPSLNNHDTHSNMSCDNYKIKNPPNPELLTPPKLSRVEEGNDDEITYASRSRGYIAPTNLVEARVPQYRRLFSDELSVLTETFNTMTDALDEHYALLEERVRARTKQLEAAKIEAEAANEAKTVFIANISHELRTPLSGILGMTTISMEETDIHKIRNNLKLIFRSGELLLHILTELLTFSKNVLQRTKLEKRNFCITDVALQIKSIFGKVAKDQRVKLSIILYPNVIRTLVLFGDSNRIIQIVMNLVSNALKFTPVDGNVDVSMKVLGEYDQILSEQCNHKKIYVKKGTEVVDEPSSINLENIKDASDMSLANDTLSLVSTSSSSYDDALFSNQFKNEKKNDIDDSDSDDGLGVPLDKEKTWVIEIEVKDTGPGIDKSLQEAVFEPFVQGDQTLSRQYGGTGLGLSICRQLATMMNGTMELESELGVGSRFIFTVPLTQRRVINYDMSKNSFEDEFNPDSKKNRKIKFKVHKDKNHSRTSDNDDKGEDTHKSESSTESSAEGDDATESILSYAKETASTEKNRCKVNLDRPFLQSTGTARNILQYSMDSSKDKTIYNEKTITDNDKKDIRTNNGTHIDTTDLKKKKNDTEEFTTDDNKRTPGIKILVAEDNHVNQEVIKRMLQLEGIKDIDLACDGQDAFNKVSALQADGRHYSIIFMDVQMPHVDGLLATRMIRNDLSYSYPIVALTAFADDSNIKECLEAGMNGFLSKPIKRTKLKTIIKEFSNE